jgi:hypothetical protein
VTPRAPDAARLGKRANLKGSKARARKGPADGAEEALPAEAAPAARVVDVVREADAAHRFRRAAIESC